MLHRILAALMLMGMLGAIAGCNTIEGMGKDIERGGAATQETARDAKRNM
jgi:entericidin B